LARITNPALWTMRQTSFLPESRNYFPIRNWHWMIAALQQDPVIFNDLTLSSLGQDALDKLRAIPEDWTPASLSLLTLGNPVQLGEIKKLPLMPLPADLRQDIKNVYEQWYRNPQKPASIKDAGLIALSLRERLRIKGSWDGFHEEYEGKIGSSQTVIACLYGMIPDVNELIETLISKKIRNAYTNLVVHAILCNPLPPESQFEIFKALLKGKDLEYVLDILIQLEAKRPVLTKTLAHELITNGQFHSYINSNQEFSIVSINDDQNLFENQIVKLTKLLRLTTLQGLSDYSGEEESALSESIEIAQKINAGLHEKLALTMSRRDNPHQTMEDRLKIWKIAVQNDPHNPNYIVGLSNALVESGRLKDARAYLETCLTDYERPLDPLLFLAVAKIAFIQGESSDADEYAQKAYSQIDTSDSFFGQDFLSLAELLIAEDYYHEAVDVIERGLLRFPNYPDLLSLLSNIKLHVGDIDDSLQKSYLALALHGINSNGEFPFELETETRKRIIENLSLLNDWESALNERISLAEMKGYSDTEDYHEIADIALKAKLPEQVINYCKSALAIDEQDGTAFYLMGKADLELENFQSAINSLKIAVQYQPESSKPWLTLAGAYKEKGDESGFIETLNEAVHAAPEDPDIQFALGKAYLERNLPSRALEFFKLAVKFLPGISSSEDVFQQEPLFVSEQKFAENPGLSFELSYYLGETLSQLGYKEDARRAFKHAYEYALNSERFNVGNFIESGQAVNEKVFLISQSYARILMELDEYEETIQVLGFADRYGSLDEKANIGLSKALLMVQPSQPNAERAVEILEKNFHLSTELSSKDITGYQDIDQNLFAEALALYAEALALTGDIQKAKVAFRFALDTPLAGDLFWRARLSIGLGRIALLINEPEMALASLQEAEKIQKADSNLYQLLAEAYLETGLLPEAYSAAKTALELKSSENQILDWFAGLAVKIINQKEIKDQNILSECIHILETSVLENPKQSNLLLRLIQLELTGGNYQKAVETIDALSISGYEDSAVDIELILEVSAYLRKSEATEYAVKLLKVTIDHLLSLETGQDRYQEQLLSSLYFELSKSYSKNGDKEQILQSLEQAVKFDPENVDIYRKSVIVLRGTGDYAAAIPLVQEGLNKFPEDFELHQYTAELLFLSGELKKAIESCDAAIKLPDSEIKNNRKNRVILIAAEIARSILLIDRAYKYINLYQYELEDPDLNFVEACIRAELALETENIEEAHESLERAEKIKPDNPIIKILSARLKCRSDINGALNLLNAGNKDFENLQNEHEGLIPGVGILSSSYIWRSLGTAWMELNHWDLAIEKLTRVVHTLKHDPLSHILLAKSLAGRAETQRLSEYLDVHTSAPGEFALDINSSSEFKEAISTLDNLYAGINTASETDELSLELKNCFHNVGLLKIRGELAFKPSLDTLEQFGESLFERNYSPDDLFTYLLGLYKFESEWSIQARDLLFQELKTRFGETIENPKILFILGLVFSEQDQLTALDYLLQSEQLFLSTSENLPIRLPIIKYLIAKIALKAGEFSAAIGAIQAALDIWPDEPVWCEFASDLFQNYKGGNGFPDLKKAAVLLEHAIEIDETEISRFKKLGDLYSRLGEYSSAENILEKALKKEPENGDIWFALAEIQLQIGDLDSAASSAAKAIENSTDGLKPLLLRGEIDIQKNNPKGAYEIAQGLLEHFPNHEQVFLMLSRALVLLGRSPEAINLLQAAEENVKNPLLIQLEYIRLLAKFDGYDEALRKLKELYRTNPENPKVMYAAVELLNGTGKEGQAVEIAKKALKTTNDELSLTEKAQLHFLIGHHFHLEGQLDQALLHLKASEQLDPKNIDSYIELGQVYHERRQFEEAMNHYRKSIELAPDNYYPYYLAGLLLKDQKDYSQAESVLRKASKLEPENATVNRLLSAVTALDLVHNQKLTSSHISTLI